LKKRISKDEYYLGIAKEVSKRCTCLRRRIGAVIVREDQIIATGYVGAPRKTKDCFRHGFCLRDKLNIPSGHRYELCRSVHAENNAIISAARAGVSLLGGTMYIWASNYGKDKPIDAFPCFICKKAIINILLNISFPPIIIKKLTIYCPDKRRRGQGQPQNQVQYYNV